MIKHSFIVSEKLSCLDIVQLWNDSESPYMECKHNYSIRTCRKYIFTKGVIYYMTSLYEHNTKKYARHTYLIVSFPLQTVNSIKHQLRDN